MSYRYPLKNAVFIHVPKCGGTYLQNVLRSRTSEVAAAHGKQFARHIGRPQLNLNPSERCFSIVRNPLMWFPSYYQFSIDSNHAGKKWEPDSWHPTDCLSTCDWSNGFESWLDSVYEQQPAFYTRMIEWMLGPVGMFKIKTFRLEDNPFQDILKWLEFTDLTEVVAPAGRNATSSPKPMPTESQKALIEKHEAAFLLRFY